MKPLFFRSLILLLISVMQLHAGVKPTIGSKKPLPLDGVPGVTMKNRTNSLYLPDRVIVKLMPQVRTSLSKTAVGIRAIDQVLSQVSVVSVAPMFPEPTSFKKPGELELSLIYTVTFSSPNDPFTLAEQLSQLTEVQYAEPWFIYPVRRGAFLPNDPFFISQWGLQKIGAPAAWDITQGDTTVVIAIVDTGVDWAHPDLSANIWTNPGEIPNNGIDDDGNGAIDDVNGWDLVGADYRVWVLDNDPSPTARNNDHGTHVAGIAAASTNNGIGIASIGFRCRILPVKCSADNDFRGSDSTAFILAGYQGIVYAVKTGAKIINCSWGSSGGSQFEQEIINFASQQGALVIAAAGNGNTNLFFSPAGYSNVLAVAATDQSDRKAFFSNYGEFVDVASPGTGILSTLFTSPKYATWDGTSMASPLVAGLAGLVKSRFPQYTGLQIGEQIRVTCDNIDAANPLYIGELGRGRINALRALTETGLPSVRMVKFTITDLPGGNGDGVAQPAETLNVSGLFRNYLAPTSANATLQLTAISGFLTVVKGTYTLGQLNTLDSINNAVAPFRVFVHADVPQSYTGVLQLTFTDGSFTDVQRFSFLVNPTYQTHNINAIQMTLTNNGKIGFFDFPQNKKGVGFVFNGANHLFEGGLIIGSSATKLVDVIRNEIGGQNADFFSSDFFTLKTPGVVSQQDGHTMFTDNNASSTNKLGLQLNLDSYAFSTPGDDKYLILSYTMKNTTAQSLTGVYIGVFLDWDIGEYDSNVSEYDTSRSLGYAYEIGPTRRKEYVGIRAMDGASSFRSLDRDLAVLTRSGKWDWISGGFAKTTIGPTDIHHVISSGPYTLQPGASRTVGFAMVAGDSSLANIRENADAAKAKWNVIRNPVSVEEAGASVPAVFSLKQNFPNPFNPATRIEFDLPRQGFARLKVFDVIGREIETLVEENLHAGTYRMMWKAEGLPSGIYFYRLQFTDRDGNQNVETRKLLLLQ